MTAAAARAQDSEEPPPSPPPIELPEPPAGRVLVQIFEGVPEATPFQPTEKPVAEFVLWAMGLVDLPRKYNASGVIDDWRQPLLVRFVARVNRIPGETSLILRAKDSARIVIDGAVVAQTRPITRNLRSDEAPPAAVKSNSGRRPIPLGHQESIVSVSLSSWTNLVGVEAVVGSQKLRPEPGELTLSLDRRNGALAKLLSPSAEVPLTDASIDRYAAQQLGWLAQVNASRRRHAALGQVDYWRRRHDLARAEVAKRPEIDLPTVSDVDAWGNPIDGFINARLYAAKVNPTPLADDWEFLRRVTLDTVGVIPAPEEIAAFRSDASWRRRERAVDRLLADPRWADHWVSYWQDVLAENPNILKGRLNNTGPFRWWIYESLLDNKPFDRFATELVMMEGSAWYGGPAGFGVATDNDAPLAEKAHVISQALLAVEMKCARCHDAPLHEATQRDAFSLAAMIGRGAQMIPPGSVIPSTATARRSAVKSSLQVGDSVAPEWTLTSLTSGEPPASLLRNPKDSRERLAAIITSPSNARFPQVIVNRLWARWLGRGLVEPVDDWEHRTASHPQLLEWLARELMTHDYDLKHVARLILTSQTYQRQVAGDASREARELFATPTRRRLSAEQLVDSLLLAAGKELRVEQLCLDPESRRGVVDFLNLGTPRRAWEMTSLANERDRPSLTLPMAQHVVDVLAMFGWRDARQGPLSVRDEQPTVLQPALLANGVVGRRIAALSEDSGLTELALVEQSLPLLIDAAVERVLSRPATVEERELFVKLLRDGFETRRTGVKRPPPPPTLREGVTWSNHQSSQATSIKLGQERALREGEAPTVRLANDWRERMEDLVWALVNTPEFVFVP